MNPIIPSIIAQNQQELDTSLAEWKGLSSILHLDIVDGKFAPNHSLNFSFKIPHRFKYQAHLMMKNPEPWIKRHLNKIDLFIPHFEAIHNHSRYILWMKQMKKKVAFAILPQTQITHLKEHLPDLDYLLILTVHPGFYGSKYLKEELLKIKKIKTINPKIKVIVDGGMNPKTIKNARKAGGDVFVSGSYLQNGEPKKRLAEEKDSA